MHQPLTLISRMHSMGIQVMLRFSFGMAPLYNSHAFLSSKKMQHAMQLLQQGMLSYRPLVAM